MTIKPFSFDERVTESSATTVTCIVDETALVAFKWLKNGLPFHDDKPIVVITNIGPASMLLLNQIGVKDAANYTCVAQSDEVETSHSAALTVASPPRWILEPHDTVLQSGQQQVTIDCISAASPKPIIRWKFENQEGMVLT